MERADLAWLGSAILLVVFVALEPLLAFPIFGSDTGEYYTLTATLLSSGHLPSTMSYAGWGVAYPQFPGLFEVSAAAAGATGTDVLTALQVVAPVLGALAILPLFLLFRRLVPNDRIAILGAALSSVFMPRMFSVAHPAPLALGDFLVVGMLWMFVESRRDARWYVPLTVSAAGLVITHHLSSYFFVVSALGLVVLTEFVWPRRWSLRFPVREFVFLAGFLGTAFAFWYYNGNAFQKIVATAIPHHTLSPALVVAGTFGGIAFLGLLVAFRRRHVPRPTFHVKFPSDRSVIRDAAILLIGIYGGLAILIFRPLPGTSQVTNPLALLFFSPLLIAIVFTTSSRRLLGFSRLGPLSLLWTLAVGLSALVALAAGFSTISPARHAEYLVLPLGLLAAISLGRLVGLVGDRRGRPAAIAAGLAVVIFLGANAAIAYPPPAVLGGFQEGLTNGDVAVWMWTGMAVPNTAAIASDHRLSSMVFGFDGNPATWQSTPGLFDGKNLSVALGELRSSPAPHDPFVDPISLVIVDGTMRTTGIALDPSEPAVPLNATAASWLEGPPFVVVYENGGTSAYWVDLSAVSA
ncbi:MAG: hypothetical protein L3K18_07775 [Thermoplasmata archaeon]|nr:hypothetical protein [Thermoplasmata archaeon]